MDLMSSLAQSCLGPSRIVLSASMAAAEAEKHEQEECNANNFFEGLKLNDRNDIILIFSVAGAALDFGRQKLGVSIDY